MKRLLIVNGGSEAVAGIKIAQEMGIRVINSDADINAPGMKIADDKIIMSTYNEEGTAQAALEYEKTNGKIDGVICIAADVPRTVARVAERLGLPGISMQSAILASDKLKMKDKFLQDNVKIPWYKQIYSQENLEYVVGTKAFPIIIKPVDSRGARGVRLIRNPLHLIGAYEEAQKHSPSNRVMVEEYISGPQISTETIMVNGKCYTPGVADRNYEYLDKYAPYIIENGGQMPSTLPDDIIEKVKKLVAQGAKSLGVSNGVIKGDIVIKDGNPYIIELAARLSGGYFCTYEIPLSTGVNIVKEAIKQCMGEKIDTTQLVPQFQRYVAQRYWFPSSGKVKFVKVPEKIAVDNQNIHLLELRIKEGDLVPEMRSHTARAGVVITTGDSAVEARALAESIIKKTQITTETNA